MKSLPKKIKSTKKIPKKLNKEISSEHFDINTLQDYIKKQIPHFTALDYNIIYTIFGQKEQEYLSLIENVMKENRSDSIICYGNNNQILKVFIDKAIKNYSSEILITKIEINGYFDTNEETLLKEICLDLNIESKAGYDNYRKALDKFLMKKTKEKSLIIIYCDYIDHLVHKKKQRLLYTLFELVNKSRNILLIGFTYNYNLMDQMEKRIRSRSSQKTMYINIDNFENVLNALEKTFTEKHIKEKEFDIDNEEENENNNDEEDNEDDDYSEIIGKQFYDCLICEENDEYINYIEKMVKMGMSIEAILTKIQHHLLLVQIDLEKYQKEKETNKLPNEELIKLIKSITRNIIDTERRGYTYNMLVKCTKFQLTLFICLTSCVSQYSDKVLLATFYNHFKKITTKYLVKGKRSDFDLILVQKYLEDLNNCNLISIKNDEKYGKIYQLKLPLCEIKKILRKLKQNQKLDDEMLKLCDNIKW